MGCRRRAGLEATEAGQRPARFAVCSAIAGEQVIPRPPGPVTSQVAGATSSRCTTRVVSTVCAYTPAQRRRIAAAAAEQPLGDLDQVLVGRGVDVERERLVVLVRVADGQPAVEALDHEQLHAVLGGHRPLRPGGPERVERGAGVGRVVAEAVPVGHRGGQCLAQRVGLHHLQPHAPDREFGGEFADQAGEPRAGAQHDEVALVGVPVVVADAGAGHEQVAHLAPGQPRVEAGRREVGAQRGQCDPGLDRAVAFAPQGRVERAAQGRVVAAGLVRREQFEAALGGVRQREGRLGHRDLLGAPAHGERAGRAKAGTGHVGADPLPQLAGPQCGVQLVAARPATDPHQAEVAHRGTARFALALDVHDLVASVDGLPGVHGPQHATSDDYDSHRLPPWFSGANATSLGAVDAEHAEAVCRPDEQSIKVRTCYLLVIKPRPATRAAASRSPSGRPGTAPGPARWAPRRGRTRCA